MEATLNATKQKETHLINDINKMEKKLINEQNYSKDLDKKLSKTEKDLQSAQSQTTEIQKALKKAKTSSKLEIGKTQERLNTLEREKEEIIMREDARIKVTYTRICDLLNRSNNQI